MKKFNLLVPMAGMGSRFLNEGYKIPKQILNAGNKHLIDISLDCIEISECNLTFVVRDDHVFDFKIDEILKDKFGEDINVVVTDGLTEGSVCSCLLAEKYINNDLPLVIHTLDVEFSPRIDVDYLENINDDGHILTFKSNSKNYSYAQVDSDTGKILKTAEKKVISSNACVGIYYFKTGKLFCEYAQKMIDLDLRTKNEFYISPLYNLLVENNLTVGITQVEKMHIFGTPKEYDFYRHNVLKRFGNKPIALCADHSGYAAKERFKGVLEQMNLTYIDFGTYIDKDCDYIPYVEQSAKSVKDRNCDYAFIFCRTGQGVNMCANKIKDIRSALIYDLNALEMAVRHNCANFFAFPSKLYSDMSDNSQEENIREIITTLSSNTFDGGRHQNRVQQTNALEEN